MGDWLSCLWSLWSKPRYCQIITAYFVTIQVCRMIIITPSLSCIHYKRLSIPYMRWQLCVHERTQKGCLDALQNRRIRCLSIKSRSGTFASLLDWRFVHPLAFWKKYNKLRGRDGKRGTRPKRKRTVDQACLIRRWGLLSVIRTPMLSNNNATHDPIF
jgi:hypothetical protein